jgi:predicted nucleic acid-binding protein
LIVIDASVALAWAHADEQTPAILALAETVSREGGVAPAIWPTEVANALQMAVRRKRISILQRDQLLINFDRLAVEVESPLVSIIRTRVIPLAHQYGLTVYDASYLELAIRRELPLATLDGDLARAANQVGIAVLP